MVVTDCSFDPVRDIAPVEQFGFIDLKSALDSSIVPSQMPESEQDYNGIENPEEILGHPRDIFEAIDAQKVIEVSGSQASGEGEQADE